MLNIKKIFIKPEIYLVIAILFLYLIGLGNVAIRDWDEGYYATVAQDMNKSHNWLYPTYLGEPFFFKPPLLFWLISISYNLGGVSELTSRLPTTLLSGFGVFLLYLLTKEIAPNKKGALLTAIVYLTLLPVARHNRLCMLDGLDNTFLIFSIWSIFKSKKVEFWAIGLGIGLGLIAMTKGLLVLAFFPIILIFLIWDKSYQILFTKYCIIGFILGFIPIFTWYFIQYKHYGQVFIDAHFTSQFFNRVTTNLDGHKNSFFYYFLELIKYGFPWLLFLPKALIYANKNCKKNWAKLSLVWTITYITLISLMQTKLPWYIFPIYPFLSIMIGIYLQNFSDNIGKENNIILVFSLNILSILSLISGIYLFLKDKNWLLFAIFLILTITFIIVAKKIQKKDPQFVTILSMGLYISLSLLMLSPYWIWEINEAYDVKPVAILLKSNTPLNQKIYTSFDYSRPSLDFYSQRRVIPVDLVDLQKIAKDDKINYLLITPSILKQIGSDRGIVTGTSNNFILWKTIR